MHNVRNCCAQVRCIRFMFILKVLPLRAIHGIFQLTLHFDNTIVQFFRINQISWRNLSETRTSCSIHVINIDLVNFLFNLSRFSLLLLRSCISDVLIFVRLSFFYYNGRFYSSAYLTCSAERISCSCYVFII